MSVSMQTAEETFQHFTAKLSFLLFSLILPFYSLSHSRALSQTIFQLAPLAEINLSKCSCKKPLSGA